MPVSGILSGYDQLIFQTLNRKENKMAYGVRGETVHVQDSGSRLKIFLLLVFPPSDFFHFRCFATLSGLGYLDSYSSTSSYLLFWPCPRRPCVC